MAPQFFPKTWWWSLVSYIQHEKDLQALVYLNGTINKFEMHPLRAGVGSSVSYIKHEEDLGALVGLNGTSTSRRAWLSSPATSILKAKLATEADFDKQLFFS
jgi:hypothetical protein